MGAQNNLRQIVPDGLYNAASDDDGRLRTHSSPRSDTFKLEYDAGFKPVLSLPLNFVLGIIST